MALPKSICIKIETGDLGMKAGVSNTERAGGVFSIVVDPSRLADPEADLLPAMLHEFMHVVITLAKESDQEAPEHEKVRAIDVQIGDHVVIDGVTHRVTGLEVHANRGDGLMDGDVRIKWDGGSTVVRHDDTMLLEVDQ